MHVLKSMWENAKQALIDYEVFKTLDVDGNGLVDLPRHMKSGVTFCQLHNANGSKPIRFFTYPNGRGGFNVQAVNKPGRFALEESLPFGGEKAESIPVQGITFVHASGFLGAGNNLNSCHALANYNYHQS